MAGSCPPSPSKHTRITDADGRTDGRIRRRDWIELELPKFTDGAEAFRAACFFMVPWMGTCSYVHAAGRSQTDGRGRLMIGSEICHGRVNCKCKWLKSSTFVSDPA